MRFFKRKSRRGMVAVIALVGLFGALLLVVYLGLVTREVGSRIEQLRAQSVSQFFGVFPPLQKGHLFTKVEFQTLLEDIGYRQSKNAEELDEGEYVFRKSEEKETVLLHRPPFAGVGHVLERLQVEIGFEKEDQGKLKVEKLQRTDNSEELTQLDFPPRRLTAYYAGRVRSQNPVPLSEIPVTLRHAVMAIEDTQFLEHPGVSLRAIVRALWRDLRAGRFVEGGSTITQQLMKNLFFSREKSLIRKVQEAIYAIATEFLFSKEEILEAYLNEVYLGQWSTHEIHGVSEGSRFYFNQSVEDISLAQSATLAAMIQLPNAHDPYRASDRVVKRRNLVLKKMFDAGFILDDEYQEAAKEPLAVVAPNRNLEDIGYFMDLVIREIPESIRQRLSTESLTVYTSLNPFLQAAASKGLKENLERLIKGYAAIKKREEKGIRLQSALVAIDIPTCSVVALQGGSSYRQTQFNRVLQGKRQPGSLFKPFVYLAAFAYPGPDGEIHEDTKLDGSPFEWAYEGGQVWKPRNYDKDSPTEMTVREALQKSVNIPTARLAQKVGIGPIVDLIKRAGIESPVPMVPSVSLGSVEVAPLELASAYVSFATNGKGCHLRPVFQIFDEGKNILADFPLTFEQRLPEKPVYQVNKILQGVFTDGTAVSAQGSGLKLEYFAGKTGTTNDYKDAWFVGYSTDLLALVWVGYDEEEKVGLTGSAAALPLWVDFMKAAQPFMQEKEFPSP